MDTRLDADQRLDPWLRPQPAPPPGHDALRVARIAAQNTHQWNLNQQMGRRWAVGCVAVEITQRCNLDCTLCYLSENAESIHDIPLQEVYRRIDLAHAHYGPDTDIQITGGDPTLRPRAELIAIVKYAADRQLRPTLMTNGIKAERPLLSALRNAGLVDVAFHVDITQQRRGFSCEQDLNQLRLRYIEAARGLGLNIMFNTTVCAQNLWQLPHVLRFFADHARDVRLVSFQVQAETGRGTEGARPADLSPQRVWQVIETSLGTKLNAGAIRGGHQDCNRYGIALLSGGAATDLLDESDSVGRLMTALRAVPANRARPWRTGMQVAGQLLRRPRALATALGWLWRKCRALAPGVWRCRQWPTTLSVMVHNFMAACELDPERLEACTFKTMTAEGPLSMCAHNARRDDFLLQPLALGDATDDLYWHPLTGKLGPRPPAIPAPVVARIPLKLLKGRARLARLQQRRPRER